MPTAIENLITRRDAVCAELAALNSTKAGGLPNADGSGLDHMGYKKSLYDELDFINKQIEAINAADVANAVPYEVFIRGTT